MNRSPEETILYIIVPCYDEAELLMDSANVLSRKIGSLVNQKKLNIKSKILLVNDGSSDNSWKIIEEICQKDQKVLGISLAKNRGHQNALYAGLMIAKDYADVTVSIDADLQQDVEAIDKFLNEYYLGNDIVYGVRNSRDTDSVSKKATANIYYSIMKFFGVNIVRNAADYRLLSRKAMEALSEYKEINLFLRGIVTDIGMKSSIVKFDVFPRKAGDSKYTFRKMMKLAIDGITSFTTMPLHIISVLGLLCIVLSVVMIVYVFIDWILKNTVPGYATILISIWLVGGLILFSLGVVGEYIGQTYIETKHRPRYCIDDICLENKDL